MLCIHETVLHYGFKGATGPFEKEVGICINFDYLSLDTCSMPDAYLNQLLFIDIFQLYIILTLITASIFL